MIEWAGITLITAVVTIVATSLLSKLLKPVRDKISCHIAEKQREREKRELYIKLLKMQSSRKRKKEGPKR